MSVRENKQAGRPWFAFEGVQKRHTLIFSQLVKGWGGKLGFRYSIDGHIVLSMGGERLGTRRWGSACGLTHHRNQRRLAVRHPPGSEKRKCRNDRPYHVRLYRNTINFSEPRTEQNAPEAAS